MNALFKLLCSIFLPPVDHVRAPPPVEEWMGEPLYLADKLVHVIEDQAGGAAGCLYCAFGPKATGQRGGCQLALREAEEKSVVGKSCFDAPGHTYVEFMR